MVVLRAAVGFLSHHCPLWPVPRSGRVARAGVRTCKVCEGDGGLVVIVAVLGLLDPQRALQHAPLRCRVAQVVVRLGEVRAGEGVPVVTCAVEVATTMPTARGSTSLFVAGLLRAPYTLPRLARVAVTW